MSTETVARRYANALADVIFENDESENVVDELDTWQESFNSSPELRGAFYSPAIPHLSKEKVLESLIEKSKTSKTTANFLRILLKNNRIAILGDINTKLKSVLEERSGVVSALVTSARDLSEGEKTEMRKSLESATGGREIRISYEIDESIIGGAITRVGSTVYDGSVKTQLDTLRGQMIKNS